jgi:hypothetical protein
MRHLSWLLLAGVLTACASGSPRTLSDQHLTYDYSDFFRVVDGRDTQVIVRGNPFAMSQSDMDQLVTSNMAAMPRGPKTNYTTAKSTNAHPDYEVVWLFNGPRSMQPNELCSNPQAVNGQPGPAAQLRVLRREIASRLLCIEGGAAGGAAAVDGQQEVKRIGRSEI